MGISFSLSSFWELLVSRWPELVTELFRHINMRSEERRVGKECRL